MEKEIIVPPVDIKKFFRHFVETLQPVKKIRPREADVLAELLYYSYLKRDINNLKDRFRVVFDPEIKLLIQESIGVSDASFNNCVSFLRKDGIIGKHNVIHPFYLIEPKTDTIELKFIFQIKKEEVKK